MEILKVRFNLNICISNKIHQISVILQLFPPHTQALLYVLIKIASNTFKFIINLVLEGKQKKKSSYFFPSDSFLLEP